MICTNGGVRNLSEYLTCEAVVINDWEGEIVGEALKTTKKISFLGDVDPNTGIILAKDSDIKGKSIKGKILVFPGGRGSTVGAGVLFGLVKNNVAPLILITLVPDQVVISGAIFGDLPMVSYLPQECFNKIKTGDTLKVRIINEKKAEITKHT